MEDLLYILAVLAWVVYSFYKNSKKARKQRPAMKEPGERDSAEPVTEEEAGQKEYPEVRSILQELLGEEVVPEPKTAEQRQQPRPKPVTAQSDREDRRYESLESGETWDDIYENAGKMPATIAEEQEEIRKEIEADVKKAMKKEETGRGRIEFDLRKAVVMSEILHRPYDETKPERAF